MSNLGKILAIQGENDTSTVALDQAVLLAKDSSADLLLVDVKAHLDAYTSALEELMPGKDLRALIVDHRKQQLLEMLPKVETAGPKSAATVLDGVPFIEIIKQADRAQVDLIVKVADGVFDAGDTLLGTTDMHLIRKSPAPVLILNKDSSPPKNVVVAIDVVAMGEGERTELFKQQIMSLAKMLADIGSAKLHVVSAWHLEGESTMLSNNFLKIDAQLLDDLLDQAKSRVERHQGALKGWFQRAFPEGPEPFYHCIKGQASEVVPDFVRSQNADMLVMGSVSRVDLPGLLIGSTAESVLGNVRCSVATIKPQGFVSPVIGC